MKKLTTPFMSQIILYGGIPLTRQETVKLMQAQGQSQDCIQAFAFGYAHVASQQEIATWHGVPRTTMLALASA